jgi:hypothetical protein
MKVIITHPSMLARMEKEGKLREKILKAMKQAGKLPK